MVSKEMPVADRSQQILEFAVAKEKQAEKFYLRWSERANNEEVGRFLRETNGRWAGSSRRDPD